MINKDVDISIPLLWGDEHFIKNEWGHINYIVGPNGTGKSLLAEEIKNHFSDGHFKPRYLNAERMVGLEKASVGSYGGGSLRRGFNLSSLKAYKNEAEQGGLSSSAIVTLQERLDIRIKIEALLSDIFGKRIRLVEEGGFLKPRMQNIGAGQEYEFSQNECHGLKELITLLTFLYNSDKNCLIFDEPELHLHPQFQSFFLQEIRKIAGNPLEDPSKKIFFIITHSPYFIDLRTIDDLRNILVCHLNRVPTYVNDLEENDQYILKKFLPRFNTHHKQFFFSPNPVFVEGYTDQQIISIMFEKMRINIGASGSCIIDVGGKDELGVFYKLCKSLKIDCRIIADLDALFRGRLREVVSEDERSQHYVQQQGVGPDLSREIGDLEIHLSSIANYLIGQDVAEQNVIHLKEVLEKFSPEEEHKKRVSVLLGILRFENEIRPLLNEQQLANLNFVIGRISQLFNAFKASNVYILPQGEIEHYYTQSQIDYLNTSSNKDSWFHTERDHLLQLESEIDVTHSYPELIPVIKEAVPLVEIEVRKHLKFEILEWIHRVQTGIAKKEINTLEELQINARVDYQLYQQILDIDSLTINADRTFQCRITIKELLTGEPIVITFNQRTIAHNFEI